MKRPRAFTPQRQSTTIFGLDSHLMQEGKSMTKNTQVPDVPHANRIGSKALKKPTR